MFAINMGYTAYALEHVYRYVCLDGFTMGGGHGVGMVRAGGVRFV
jgi:hypothetical protein